MSNFDPVNRPAHYTEGRVVEVIDLVEDWDLGFCLGNAIKYLGRAGRKDPKKTIEDYEKTIWYINRHKKYGKFGITTIIRYIVRERREYWKIEDVIQDWKVDYNIEGAIYHIKQSLKSSKEMRDWHLNTAVVFVTNAIIEIRKKERNKEV